MHIPRVFPLGRCKIGGVLLSVAAFSWIAGCGSGDPATANGTWKQVESTHTVPSTTTDSDGGSDDRNAAASEDGGADASDGNVGPVQTYRNPDGSSAKTCAAPNALCPVVNANADAGGDDDDDDDDAAGNDAGATACVALQTDPGNCGTCGTTCSGDDATCIGGKCACSGIQEEYCDTGCVNIGNDPNNCGACGTTCSAGQTCNGGTCQDDDDCCSM